IEAERPLPAPLELTISSSIPKILAPKRLRLLSRVCRHAWALALLSLRNVVSSTCVSDSRLASRHCLDRRDSLINLYRGTVTWRPYVRKSGRLEAGGYAPAFRRDSRQ